MRIGVLTGGGDAPGLNAVIRGIVMRATKDGHEVIGFRNGWAGLINNEQQTLTKECIEDIHMVGGTILHTSRTNPYKTGEQQKAIDTIKNENLDCIIAIGGDDTLGVANKLRQEGINVVGVPKTIDNDLSCTDVTFGFDTATNIAAEAIEKIHTTAKSHHRIMIVEVMGREAGWIAMQAGLAGGAHCILIPEQPFNLDELSGKIQERHNSGKTYTMLVVSEGAKPDGQEITQNDEKDSFGHARLGGIGNYLEKELQKRTNIETRATILGHLQRSGSPSAYDRVLATRFGVKAAEMAHDGEFGKMAALHGNQIVAVDIHDAVSEQKLVSDKEYEFAKEFFW